MVKSMAWTGFRQELNRLAEQESLRPDLGRALRSTIALMAALIPVALGRLPMEAVFSVLVAMNIAMIDVRGPYAARFSILLSATLVLAGCAALGGLLAPNLWTALAGMAAVAVLGGLWRQLSNDYGPSVAVAAALLYVIALAEPGGRGAAGHHALASLGGGLWGLLLQVAFWPLRPEHPLRRSVGDAWLAVSDLAAALAPPEAETAPPAPAQVPECEAALRTALDQAYLELRQAAARRRPDWINRLEALRQAAAQFALLVGAVHTALEAARSGSGVSPLESSYQSLFAALKNVSRTIAVAVVSRQPGHFATCEVRLRRLNHLLEVLRSAPPPPGGAGAELGEMLRRLQEYLPEVGQRLRATIGRADEHAAFSLELFDLETWALRPLAASLNPRARVDRSLVLHTARITVLTLIGVVLFKALRLPHGYWIPFTMVVVLQPDYGSTRRKAAQRMLGTLTGSVAGSLMLWLRLPLPALFAAIALSTFIFVYLLKRRYGLAVFFITIFVVLLTESFGPVRLAFTFERLADTTAGGVLALVAALIFWPVWERGRFPPILAGALRANGEYLRLIAAHLRQGLPYDHAATLAKRRAEKANAAVFSSLQRMMGDPKARQARLEEAAALANGNQRLTRALNLVALELGPPPMPDAAAAPAFADDLASTLEALAAAIELGGTGRVPLDPARRALQQARPPGAPAGAEARPRRIAGQFSRAATEVGAMLLAAETFT